MCRGLRALSGGVMRIAVVDKAVKVHPVGVLEHADWVDFDRLVDNSYAHNAAR